MAYGNRLCFGKAAEGFYEPEMGCTVARSGWTWGVSCADFDNDGFPDIYLANGMISGPSVRDVEGELWRHDIFVGTKAVDAGASTYFDIKNTKLVKGGLSQGGYDKNRLYLNRAGREFVDVAHLFGVASEEDCRNAMAADFDGDGRADIAFTTTDAWPPFKQRIHVYKNNLSDSANWIGLRFRDEPGHISPVGARATLRVGKTTRVEQYVTGESFRSQHPANIRFGLGQSAQADAIEINWPGGGMTRLAGLEKNRWFEVSAPKR
jgi:hypothetical protein